MFRYLRFKTTTWGALPGAASQPGYIYRVTDYGVAGVGLLVISDGTRWLPLGPQLLARSAVAVALTGTTSETVLATVTVPARLLGVSGGLSCRTVWSASSATNNKTMRIRFGGASGTAFASVVNVSVANELLRTIRNRNAANSQVGSNSAGATGPGPSGSANATSAVDTTAAADLVISGQLAVGTDTQTLESYEVWVTP